MNLLITIRNETDRKLAVELAGKVIADYGHAILMQLDNFDPVSLKSKGLRFREAKIDPALKINGYRFDTSLPSAKRTVVVSPQSTGVVVAGGEGKQKDYCVLQLVGPMHPEWIKDLKSTGTRMYSSLGNNGYLVGIDSDKVSDVESRPYVASVSEYLPQFKIAQHLLTLDIDSRFIANAAARMQLDAGVPSITMRPLEEGIGAKVGRRREPKAEANLKVVLFEELDREKVISELKKMDNVSISESEEGPILIRAEEGAVAEIAKIPAIREVEPNFTKELHNNIASKIVRADVVNSALGLSGAGQIVAVADTGIDTGNAATVSLDFRGRVLKIHALGRSAANDASDPHGHGTHVAGSILGDGSNSSGLVQGMAPKAKLIFQSVLDASGGLGGLSDLEKLLADAMGDGAKIHNNSWGNRFSNGVYSSESSQFDKFSFENRDFLILASAGNDGPSLRVTSPGTAKNALTVGASESLRALPTVVTFPTSPIFPMAPSMSGLNTEADSDRDTAVFSCPGPTENDRRKPDVVAPGTWILSARSSVSVADTGPDGLTHLDQTTGFPNNGTGDEDGIDSHEEAVGLGLPGQPILFAGSVNTPDLPAGTSAGAALHYMYQSGTSMASPITAGCCALIREYYEKKRIHVPSAALVKATIVNGATSIRTSVPDVQQGWGRISVVDSITPNGLPVQFDDDLAHAVQTTQRREYRADVGVSGNPVTVTLVWRDPPAKTIQNQLYLRVFDGNDTTEFSSDSVDDIRNNVQKVTLSPTSAFIRIEVEATNVIQGVPERSAEIAQDFALVVGNATSLALTS